MKTTDTFRESFGATQQEMADLTGTSRSAWAMSETGKANQPGGLSFLHLALTEHQKDQSLTDHSSNPESNLRQWRLTVRGLSVCKPQECRSNGARLPGVRECAERRSRSIHLQATGQRAETVYALVRPGLQTRNTGGGDQRAAK